MYHFFYDKEKENGKDNNFMEVTDFENQMKYLSDENTIFHHGKKWKILLMEN